MLEDEVVPTKVVVETSEAVKVELGLSPESAVMAVGPEVPMVTPSELTVTVS